MNRSAIVTSSESGLIWETEGHYTFGELSWRDVSIEVDFLYRSGEIGIIPRFYSDISYIVFRLSNYDSEGVNEGEIEKEGRFTVDAYFGSDVVQLGEGKLEDPLLPGQEYKITCVIKGTNYKVYLGDKLVFNGEYSRIPNGKGGVYSTPENELKRIKVAGKAPYGWETNALTVNGSTVGVEKRENGDNFIRIQNPTNEKLFIRQIVSVEEGEYSLSYDLKGEVTVEFYDPINATIEEFVALSENWSRQYCTYEVQEGVSEIEVRFTVPRAGEALIDNVQLEKGKHSTPYIHNEEDLNSRDHSLITYPSRNNIEPSTGAVSLWIKPSHDNPKGVLFEYGDVDNRISLLCTETGIKFIYGEEEVSQESDLLQDTFYHIVATWRSDNLALYINEEKEELSGFFNFEGHYELIRIGHSVSGVNEDTFNGVIDDLIIFSKDINEEYITTIRLSEEPVPSEDQMLLRATFDHAIGNFNKSVIEMSPAPQNRAPVLIEKEDGTSMRKVSFINKETGEYQTWNEEEILYDGYSDYIKVSYSNLDKENFKVLIRDSSGAIFGDPYTITNNRIYITASNQAKKEMKGKKLSVSYQPENAYTVDTNVGQPDSFRTTIGKYDGQPLTITYEGSKFFDEKLATMVELNPLINPNHEGFLYITRNTQEVSVFRAKASPNNLPADGVSEATVIIEPLDSNGNFISNAKLEALTSLEGSSIIPSYDVGSVLVRERAGRYIYRYRAPLIYWEDHKSKEVVDYISIKDKKTGIGIQVPVYLSLENKYYNSDMKPTLEESNWERVAARFLDVIMDYYNMRTEDLPEGLAQIIDFNEDGIINLQEIVWLNEHKYTQDLYSKYIEYLSWQTISS